MGNYQRTVWHQGWRQWQNSWSQRWRPKARKEITLSQSPACGMVEDRARAFRWEEGVFEKKESKVDRSMALERWHCWIGKSVASGEEDQSGCLDERENSWKASKSWVEWLEWYPRISDTKSWVEKADPVYAIGECREALKRWGKRLWSNTSLVGSHPPDQIEIWVWECQRNQWCPWCRKEGKFWEWRIFLRRPDRTSEVVFPFVSPEGLIKRRECVWVL